MSDGVTNEEYMDAEESLSEDLYVHIYIIS